MHTVIETPYAQCDHCFLPVGLCMCIRCPWCRTVLFGAQCLCAGSQLDQETPGLEGDAAAESQGDATEEPPPVHSPGATAPPSSALVDSSTGNFHHVHPSGMPPHPPQGGGGGSRVSAGRVSEHDAEVPRGPS